MLTDRGNEFKAAFAATCAALGIRQTRIKTRHAWTNGFVERLLQLGIQLADAHTAIIGLDERGLPMLNACPTALSCSRHARSIR